MDSPLQIGHGVARMRKKQGDDLETEAEPLDSAWGGHASPGNGRNYELITGAAYGDGSKVSSDRTASVGQPERQVDK